MTFGKKLRTARLAAGLSQAELASDRCSLSYISHLETGRRSPTPELIRYFESRLNLPAGTLGEVAEISNSQRRRLEEADLLAAYCEAADSWRAGMFAHALDKAKEVQAALPVRGHEDLRGLLHILLVNINIDLGHYAKGTEEARTHWHEAAASGSPSLEAKAACLTSRAARMARDIPLAREAATTALNLTAIQDDNPSLRGDALRASIAAAYSDSDEGNVAEFVGELSTLVPELERSHERGLCAWVVGNAKFRMGEIAEGIRWHDEAMELLSPSADLRNWARFPRASAEERMRAGTGEGVAALLEITEQRLAMLNSPDELATLALTRAQFASLHGRETESLQHVDNALEELDLPDGTRAELYDVSARTHARLGHHEEAMAMALKAARLFTEAGQMPRAQEAWKLIDEQPPTS